MTATGFSGCCGAVILCGFGNTLVASDRTPYTEEQIEKFLADNASLYKKYRYSLLVAILNGEQDQKLGALFKKHGWKRTFQSHHPAHNSELFLYAKSLARKPRKKADLTKN